MSQGKGFGGVARANLMVSMATYFQKPEIFGFENHPGTMGRREGRRSMIRRSYIFTEELNALTLGKVLATFPPPPQYAYACIRPFPMDFGFFSSSVLRFFGSSVLPFFSPYGRGISLPSSFFSTFFLSTFHPSHFFHFSPFSLFSLFPFFPKLLSNPNFPLSL